MHFDVVKADDIFTSFPQAINKLKWAENAPTNSLLISRPSRTADIEMIRQFVVHGPTDLIVFVIEKGLKFIVKFQLPGEEGDTA